MRAVSARHPLAVALVLALPFGLVACKAPTGETAAPAATAKAGQDQQSDTARLNAWFDEQYEQQLKFSPIQLTFLGRKELYDQIDDLSEAGIRKQVDWMAASVQEMESKFDYDKLDPEAQLSWDLWKKQYENARDGLPFLVDGYPFDQMNGMQNLAPTFMNDFPQPGALPIVLDGQVIGAMGVSSADGEKCAQAAIDSVFKGQATTVGR